MDRGQTPQCRSFRTVPAIKAALCLAVALLALSAPGMAAGEPQAVVAYVGAQGMATLAPNVAPAQRTARLRELFANYFDVGHIAAFALGRYRDIASPQQQEEFSRLYQDYTVEAYGARLNQIGAAPIRITAVRPYGDEVIVASEIVRPDGSRVPVDWYLVDRHGRYKITDVVIGGTSMKVAQRNEFARWIQSNGGRFDALLAVMRQEIARMR